MPLWLKILLSILIVEVLGGVGAIWTAGSIDNWYADLVKPPGTPPNNLFAPVWTTLFAMMGTSFALVWHRAESGPRKKSALGWFGGQFALNLAWTPVFFGLHQMGAALVIIVALLAAIAVTFLKFRPLDRLAAYLLVPYGIWVSYATYLNAGNWWLNR